MTTALFLLKRREDYSQDPAYSESYQIASGMYNSAMFVVDVLTENNISAEVAIIADANQIDAVVTSSNAQSVFIEGLWCTPAKLAELLAIPRHATRRWVVRIHSEMPFLATEGVAFGWFKEYLELGAVIAANSPRMHKQLTEWAKNIGYTEEQIIDQLPLLTNCYPTDFRSIFPGELDTSAKTTVDIACFGAVRVLKNHLFQAATAMEYAASIGKKLRFHINDRTSGQSATGVARNVESFFDALPTSNFELVEHGWEDRETFLQSLQACDVLMQMSLSETFNIVAADATWVGRPVIASSEIPWAYPLFAEERNPVQALKTMTAIMSNPSFFMIHNRDGLRRYAEASAARWVRYF